MKPLRKLLILCVVCILSSCSRSWYEVRAIEKLLDAHLMGEVKYVDRQEQWINLIGDGEKVVLFDVLDTTALNHLTHSMLPYDSTMVKKDENYKDECFQVSKVMEHQNRKYIKGYND